EGAGGVAMQVLDDGAAAAAATVVHGDAGGPAAAAAVGREDVGEIDVVGAVRSVVEVQPTDAGQRAARHSGSGRVGVRVVLHIIRVQGVVQEALVGGGFARLAEQIPGDLRAADEQLSAVAHIAADQRLGDAGEGFVGGRLLAAHPDDGVIIGEVNLGVGDRLIGAAFDPQRAVVVL